MHFPQPCALLLQDVPGYRYLDTAVNKTGNNSHVLGENTIEADYSILKNEAFSLNKMKGYSPCLIHLIYWEMGILEFHRAVRYFCLNFYDMKILSKEEIVFCGQMDNINIMFNKLKYYNYTYCKEYDR